MNKRTLSRKTLYISATIGLLLLAGSALLSMHVASLNNQVASLEEQVSTKNDRLALYQRSLCEGRADKTFKKDVVDYSLQSAGYERTYSVETPDNYDPTVRYPVILSFDGIEGSGDRMRGYANLDELPAIVVYLDALPGKKKFSAWQGAPYSTDGDRDLQFTKDVINAVPNAYCVDQTQQFAVGMSNGGAFATLVGCTFGDEIKAVASVSGAYYKKCRPEEKTPSLLIIHSEADTQVPYKGSDGKKLPSVFSLAEEQASQRRCGEAQPTVMKDVLFTYDWRECRDTSKLRLVVLKDQSHGWLALPPLKTHTRLQTQDTAEYIWEFFESVS